MIKIYKRVKEFCSGREGSLRKRLDEFEGKQRAERSMRGGETAVGLVWKRREILARVVKI